MSLQVHKQYRLNIPDWQVDRDPASKKWNGQIVTLKQLYSHNCNCDNCYNCTYTIQVGAFTAWVTTPGLYTSFYGNIFRAKPEWLGPTGKIPCNCPWATVSIRGCQDIANHI